MKGPKKILTIGAVIIVVLGGALYFLMGSGSSQDAIVTVNGAPSSSTEATFLGLASELETVSFDGAIFRDPRFTRLQDISTTIVTETSGRRDPFGPLQGISVTQ